MELSFILDHQILCRKYEFSCLLLTWLVWMVFNLLCELQIVNENLYRIDWSISSGSADSFGTNWLSCTSV